MAVLPSLSEVHISKPKWVRCSAYFHLIPIVAFCKWWTWLSFNRIRCEFGSYASPPANLSGDYLYGYDRMRGGFAYSGEIGYMYMSNSRLLNFSISLEFVQAHTKPLREWDFNLMMKDTNSYVDRYWGIRFSIYIPTYKRMPAEYYYY